MPDSSPVAPGAPASPPFTPAWPKTEPDAETMIRYAIGRGLWCNAATWTAIDEGAFEDRDGPAYRRYRVLVGQIIHNHDVALALKEMRKLSPEAADVIARRMWTAADAGDSYGEWLWEWAEEAGLDAQAIHDEGAATSDG